LLSYDEKIAKFALGKKLQRLSRPVRGRADTLCDACGSTQPRTLYGLTDVETGRHYFVGESCLKELMKEGYILRRFGKQSGKQAYEDEMHLRAGPLGLASNSELQGNGFDQTDDIASETVPSGNSRQAPTNRGTISSQVMMVETREHYQCLVALIHEGTNHTALGTACVAKYEEEWRAGGASGLVLEKLKIERPDAPILCLSKAWQEAYSQLVDSATKIPATSISNPPGGQINNVLLPPGTVLRLGTVPAVEGNHGP